MRSPGWPAPAPSEARERERTRKYGSTILHTLACAVFCLLWGGWGAWERTGLEWGGGRWKSLRGQKLLQICRKIVNKHFCISDFKYQPEKSSVSDPYSLNPDPAKILNPEPDPSYFLPLSDFFLFIIIRFSHQKKSIKRQNNVIVTNKLQ